MNDKPYLDHFQGRRWEVNTMLQEVQVNIGGDQWVIVDKLFGPQCSSKIRVMHHLASCSWVVEEENFHNGEWVERARFGAQEFYKPQYTPPEDLETEP